jgi:hypothetical protein
LSAFQQSGFAQTQDPQGFDLLNGGRSVPNLELGSDSETMLEKERAPEEVL